MTELPDDVLELQRLAFRYFLDHTNAKNGLVADNTREDSPCSIAATGLGLSCHPIAVVNGWLKRAEAAERVLTALRFFEHSPQGPEPDATAESVESAIRPYREVVTRLGKPVGRRSGPDTPSRRSDSSTNTCRAQ